MDERVKAGLKAGVVSWITLLLGPTAFLIAGILAVDIGRIHIHDQDDVFVSSLVAGIICTSLYSLILFSIGSSIAAAIFFPVAGILSLIGGFIYARYRLGISIDVQKILRTLKDVQQGKVPLHVERHSAKFRPGCNKKIEGDWKVCPYCRRELEQVFCPHCGCANTIGTRYCQRCRSPLGDGTVIYDDGTRVY
jgi:hypothetical protein